MINSTGIDNADIALFRFFRSTILFLWNDLTGIMDDNGIDVTSGLHFFPKELIRDDKPLYAMKDNPFKQVSSLPNLTRPLIY
jgi:hypothetical protein